MKLENSLADLLSECSLQEVYQALCMQEDFLLNEMQTMLEDILEEIENESSKNPGINIIVEQMNEMSLRDLCKIKIKLKELVDA